MNDNPKPVDLSPFERWRMGRNNRIAILDIDGCIIDMQTRWTKFAGGALTYEEYLALHMTDKMIPAGVMVYQSLLQNPSLRCIFVTARSENQRELTTSQLNYLFGGIAPNIELLMKPNGVTLHDAEAKIEILKNNDIALDQILVAFDDRPATIAEYRRHGIVAYQTAYGY